ncbi:fungal-specific transcription factor domain-containing protein [Linnemannia elongata]|nr:fungal-specific transcription factor domain-containing protein [Linnemannia elongata]
MIDALHPICSNCQTFHYDCTYNDPTKKRGPPKGYIEAIEARLHRMEGLLGGLVKDKDPRAEIVRAELDAMAREAEMTGLKLRRSKAYEEMTYAMGISTSTSTSTESKSNASTVKKETIVSDTSPMDRQPHQQQPKSSPSSSSSSEPISTSQQQPQPQPQHSHPYKSQQPSQTQNTQQSMNQHHRQQHPSHYNNYQQLGHNGSGSGSANIAHSPSTDGHNAPTFMSSSSSTQQYQYQPHHPPQQPVSQFHSHSTQSGHHAHQQHQTGNWQHYQHPTHQKHPSAAHESLAVSHRYQSSSSPSETYAPASWAGNERNGPGSMYTPRKGSDAVYRPLASDRPTHVDPLTGYMAMPRQVVPQESRLVLPSSEVMDHLFDIHFRYVHPVLPMLHRKTFYDQIHGPEPPPAHLLFAVLGLASRFSDNPVFRTPQPGADRPPCTIFYERAKELIKEEYDNSQVGTVQALLLMAIQQMGFCESQRAWLYVGMAIRMAQDLGLNCELSEQEQIRNPVLAEQRRRTWWSCYVVERLVCAGLGRPLSITQQHCETGFPRYDEPESEIGLPDGSLVGCVGIASNFVLLITLSSIQGNILQFIKARAVRNDDLRQSHEGSPSHPTLNSTSDQDRAYRVDTSPAAFAALDRSLTEWRQKLPAALQNPTADSPHYGLFLHMTYNTLIILLHRPEVFYSATSASLCTEAAAAITEITEILMRANALTSMIISCLYAIFSAGLIHFINIPSAKRGKVSSNYSSPTLSSTRPAVAMYSPASGPTALAAKANMKRCIDALKFLSSHWVSAARRAKVLEDLLDLKKVCLKDLEVDSFQTTPLMPDWVVESIKYGQALAAPREGHDQLRQKCRSKMMAIQSLLANDEEYDRMQNRRSSSMDEPMSNGDKAAESMDIAQESLAEDGSTNTPMYREDRIQSFSGSSPSASSSPNLSRGSQSQKQSYPFGADPMMLISTATFGPSGAQPSVPEANMDVEVLGGVRSFTPMTLTTLGYTSSAASSSTSPATSGYSRHGSVTTLSAKSPATSLTSASKATMLDPFSMPSSITFPEASHGRQSSYGSGVDPMDGMGGGSGSPGGSIFRRDGQDDKNRIPSSFQRMSLAGGSSPSPSSSCGDEHEQDDHDVVWSDMPPTLGLDEWMAYIGALMMRWLASGESSPRSPLST